MATRSRILFSHLYLQSPTAFRAVEDYCTVIIGICTKHREAEKRFARDRGTRVGQVGRSSYRPIVNSRVSLVAGSHPSLCGAESRIPTVDLYVADQSAFPPFNLPFSMHAAVISTRTACCSRSICRRLIDFVGGREIQGGQSFRSCTVLAVQSARVRYVQERRS